MRRRLAPLGVPVSVRAQDGVMFVTVPADVGDNLQLDRELGRSARLLFYDWEPNVIGPNGNPAPTGRKVTGDSTSAGAGGVAAGETEYRAVLRAARRPSILHANDTTWTPGCTPRQINGCLFGSWYLLDTVREKVINGPAETEDAVCSRLPKPIRCADRGLRRVRVRPGTVLVQARQVETESGKIINRSPNSYYVLNDNPVLTGADIVNPHQSLEETGGGSGVPDITFNFTSSGKTSFERLTHEVAHRGQEAQLPGMSKWEALQHFAVVLDGQLLAVPAIDFTQFPEGIDASTGSEIFGGFTIQSARNLAAELSAGALPLALVLVNAPAMPNRLGRP